ncbi:hypothetical protein BC936DRAFT_137520 [Jimgerdemannia flammicorona]|uniref:Uncharacterized protein n=1 Tax=Jimgerdemannia flammicorona TaxID=994334 RepID=A0A433CX69_9FUNG|nr:hypothetical protein BC936DRAFT_137520 [Jimgerdemannia flammicorona]
MFSTRPGESRECGKHCRRASALKQSHYVQNAVVIPPPPSRTTVSINESCLTAAPALGSVLLDKKSMSIWFMSQNERTKDNILSRHPRTDDLHVFVARLVQFDPSSPFGYYEL